MKFILTLAISASVFATSKARFAYEKGHCEISIFNVLQDMFNREVSALINPTYRYGGNKGIRYDLYTPQNIYEKQELRTGDREALRRSNFNPKWPVRFSIHGWAGKSTTCSNAAIKDAYLADGGKFNVIVLDWSDYSLDISYARISKQLASIAASFVKFIRFLQRETGISYDMIYLIGHSAGSHISGLTGKMLKPDMLGAIYALDPAGLTQLGLGAPFRLAASDAQYVESIHTDVTLLGNPSDKLSHASFFPNWGQGQPHCPNATAAEFDFACDHFAAIYYFVESVRDDKLFGALQCADVRSIEKFKCSCSDDRDTCSTNVFMGGEPAVPKHGVFYLSTRAQAPFGYGEKVRMKRAVDSTSTVVRQKNFKIRGFLSRW